VAFLFLKAGKPALFKSRWPAWPAWEDCPIGGDLVSSCGGGRFFGVELPALTFRSDSYLLSSYLNNGNGAMKTLQRLAPALFAVLLAMPAAGAGLPQAVQRSKDTGLPMLVVVTTDTCPHCVALMKRLTSDSAVAPLVQQYVPLEIKAGTADHKLWTSNIPPAGGGVPQIYIVSAEGKQIYGGTGNPQGDGLNRILQDGITQSGGPRDLSKLGSAYEKKLQEILRRLKVMVQNKRYGEAMTLIAPELESLQDADSPAAKELNELIAVLNQKAESNLAVIEAASEASGDELAETALNQAQVKRDYYAVPGVKQAYDSMISQLGADHPLPALIDQAAKLHDARRQLDDPRTKRRGMSALKQIAEEHGESPIGKLAAEQAASLSGGAAASSVASSSGSSQSESFPLRTWMDSTGKFKLEARFVEATSDGQVVLEKADGSELRVPYKRLSDADKKYSIAAFRQSKSE